MNGSLEGYFSAKSGLRQVPLCHFHEVLLEWKFDCFSFSRMMLCFTCTVISLLLIAWCLELMFSSHKNKSFMFLCEYFTGGQRTYVGFNWFYSVIFTYSLYGCSFNPNSAVPSRLQALYHEDSWENVIYGPLNLLNTLVNYNSWRWCYLNTILLVSPSISFNFSAEKIVIIVC